MSVFQWCLAAVILSIILIWIGHNLYSRGQLPEGFLKDIYDGANRQIKNTSDRFEEPIRLYERTVGYENDDRIQTALDKTIKRHKMFVQNRLNGRMSEDNIACSISNSFIAGELWRFNVRPNARGLNKAAEAEGQAAYYYNNAINTINDAPDVAIRAEIDPGFIINRVDDFYDQTQHFRQVRPDTRTIRKRINDARLSRAAEANPTSKVDTIKEYYKPLPVANDPQNVHDAEVSNGIRNVYNRIVELNGASGDHFDAIQAGCAGLPPGKQSRILNILNKFQEGNHNSMIGDSESRILNNVWARINSPDNARNKESLLTAFYESLADSMEKNYLGEYREVCLSGRCNRVINSLTLLDADPEIAKPVKTVEMLRNEIFSKSHKILDNRLAANPDIARAYNAGDDGPDVEQFREDVKNEIQAEIINDYHDSNQNSIVKIIREATDVI